MWHTGIVDAIDKFTRLHVEQIHSHLAGDQLDISLLAQFAKFGNAGDALGFHLRFHHAAHHGFHTGDGGTDRRKPLIHAHRHRHARIAER